MSQDHPPAPDDWVDVLERSKIAIAAGETVPLAPVLERLRCTAERLEAELKLVGVN